MSKLNPFLWRLLSVYIGPLVLVLVICIPGYFVVKRYGLNSIDIAVGCLVVVLSALVVSFENRTKWKSMPDGSYLNRDDNEETPAKEPANYTHEFFTTTKSKTSFIVWGVFLIGIGICIFMPTWFFLPMLPIIGGGIFIYKGGKGFVENSPKLKLAKEGLWTKKLGFKSWGAISHIEVKTKFEAYSNQTYLKIYLKNGLIKDPEQSLPLDDLINNRNIQPTIRALFRS